MQMQQRKSGEPHPAIVVDVNAAAGIICYIDANSDNANTCRMHNDSYSTFFNTSQDLSIYRCSGYNPGTSSSCSCSDSYAGEYRCTSRSTLIIRNGHGRGYGSLGEIPSGASVQVSKGDGTWTHVSYNGISGYSSMQYLERADTNHRPIFHLDSCTSSEGVITVSGWTYDQDAPNESMSVHIYVANTFNADLDDAAFVLHDHVVTEAASPIDLNLLKTVVRNSENLNQDDFSRGMDALQTSLDRARDVLNIPESQERVNAAAREVSSALLSLRKTANTEVLDAIG